MAVHKLNYFYKEFVLDITRLSIDSNSEFCKRVIKQHAELMEQIKKEYQRKEDSLCKNLKSKKITQTRYSIKTQKLTYELNTALEEITNICNAEIKSQKKAKDNNQQII